MSPPPTTARPAPAAVLAMIDGVQDLVLTAAARNRLAGLVDLIDDGPVDLRTAPAAGLHGARSADPVQPLVPSLASAQWPCGWRSWPLITDPSLTER